MPAPDLPSGDEVIAGATAHKAFASALGSLVVEVRDASELAGRARR